jgi:hypothetical protein
LRNRNEKRLTCFQKLERVPNSLATRIRDFDKISNFVIAAHKSAFVGA